MNKETEEMANGMREELLESYMRPLNKIMEEEGLSDEYLVHKLHEELEADETKTFQYQGVVVESQPKVAWEIRQRARMDAHKLKSHYPSEKHHHTFDTGLPIIPLSEEEKVELEARKQMLREKALKKGA